MTGLPQHQVDQFAARMRAEGKTRGHLETVAVSVAGMATAWRRLGHAEVCPHAVADHLDQAATDYLRISEEMSDIDVYVLTEIETGHQWLITRNPDGTGSIAERPSGDTADGWSAPTYVTAERAQ